jgi:hypothetical protein
LMVSTRVAGRISRAVSGPRLQKGLRKCQWWWWWRLLSTHSYGNIHDFSLVDEVGINSLRCTQERGATRERKHKGPPIDNMRRAHVPISASPWEREAGVMTTDASPPVKCVIPLRFDVHLGFLKAVTPGGKTSPASRALHVKEFRDTVSILRGEGASVDNQFLGIGRSNRKTALSERNVMDQTSESYICIIRWPSAIAPS